jgi:hypothetical protein
MDQEISELKELVRRSISLSQENNKMLHSMRKSARRSAIMRVVWWLAVFGVTGAMYYYYLWPYTQRILELYQNAQHALEQAQQFGSQFGGGK